MQVIDAIRKMEAELAHHADAFRNLGRIISRDKRELSEGALVEPESIGPDRRPLLLLRPLDRRTHEQAVNGFVRLVLEGARRHHADRMSRLSAAILENTRFV